MPSADSVDVMLAAADAIWGRELANRVPYSAKIAALVSLTQDSLVVSSFLRSLPVDSSPLGRRLALAADTLLLLIPDNRSANATQTALLLGALKDAAPREPTSPLPSCPAKSVCERTIRRAETGTQRLLAMRPEVLAISRPDVTKLLGTPIQWRVGVVRETTLDERQAREAGRGFIAEVRCDRGGPEIRYAPDLDERFSQLGFAFFRAHEAAHLRLAHVEGCLAPGVSEIDPSLTVVRRELDADCEAARSILLALPTSGIALVAFASGQFSVMTLPVYDYPTWRSRSDNLWRPQCG